MCSSDLFALLKLLGLVVQLRAEPRAEGLGMDFTQHGEEAYTSGEGSILVPAELALEAPAVTRVPVVREVAA